MARSQVEKQRTHERIVEIAAKRLREEGLDGIGVADLMKEAGLTVGGFYKHFASRDELVAEAMALAFGEWERRVADEGGKLSDLPLPEYLRIYLNDSHRDNPGMGCAFAALNGELARSDPKTREIATRQLKANVEMMTGRIAGEDRAEARRKALLVLCATAGAIGFSRIVDDPALSEEILDSIRAVLLETSGSGK